MPSEPSDLRPAPRQGSQDDSHIGSPSCVHGASPHSLHDVSPPRLAVPADAAVLAAIHAAAFAAPDAWSSDVFSLHLALPNVIGLLAAADGCILVRAAAEEAEILTLAVVPAVRRRGVASRLLQAAILRLAAVGAGVVFLEVSVENTAARALYLRSGFYEAGRRHGYYSDRSDALVLRLDLPSPA